MNPPDVPDYVRINRARWTRTNADYTDANAERNWAKEQIVWGVWGVPESSINSLPDVRGKDVIELGCGTAYLGAWLKRNGARRVVGVDITPAQLATAKRMSEKFNLPLELIEANAESVPLPDASFDIAVSEYGASIWCDPYKWIPEAARLLRLGGDLWFLRNSTLAMLCMPDEGNVQTSLQRPQKGLHRLEWEDEKGAEVEFAIPHGEMIRLLLKSGFEIVDMIELYAPADAEEHPYYSYVTPEWAQRWPSEEIWRVKKR